jgi:hypothetical protein
MAPGQLGLPEFCILRVHEETAAMREAGLAPILPL